MLAETATPAPARPDRPPGVRDPRRAGQGARRLREHGPPRPGGARPGRVGQADARRGGLLRARSGRCPRFEDRTATATAEKQAIGRATAALIEDGDTVLLDGGTTTLEVARALLGRPLQVVTNSLPIAQLLASSKAIDLILIGGYVYPRTGRGPRARWRSRRCRASGSARRSWGRGGSWPRGSTTRTCSWSRPSGR